MLNSTFLRLLAAISTSKINLSVQLLACSNWLFIRAFFTTSKAHMKVQLLIKDTCAIVAEDIGTTKADQIAQAAQTRFETLCAENTSDSKELRAHSYKRIYPGIAIFAYKN